MQKFLDWLKRVLTPLAKMMKENEYSVAIRDGFLLSTPLLTVGSVFLLIANFPLPQWDTWISHLLGKGWAAMMSVPANASFDIMAILTTIGIAYSLGKQFNMDAMQAGIIALASFFIVTPYRTLFTSENSSKVYEVTSLPLRRMGSNDLFLGVIVALIATRLFVAIVRKGWTVKISEGVPPAVVKSFETLTPSFLIVILMLLVNWLTALASCGNLQDVIFEFLQTSLLSLSSTLGVVNIAYLFLHFFWLSGISGGSVVGVVFNPVLRVLSIKNLQAFKDDHEVPNIITGQFRDMSATFGDAGSTLLLIIVMVLFCGSQRIKEFSQLSLVPGVFGINEPVIFGLPIVLDPILLIPFVLVPAINIIIAYFAMDWGLVPLTNSVQLPWATPPIISGFLINGWQGSTLQALLLVLGMLIYYPFIRVMDDQYLREEWKAQEEENEEIDFDSFDPDDLQIRRR